MGRPKKLHQTAVTGDARELLVVLRDRLCRDIDETTSAREVAALSNRLLSVIAMLEGMDGEAAKPKRGEVTRFDVIAKRNAEKRKAAQA